MNKVNIEKSSLSLLKTCLLASLSFFVFILSFFSCNNVSVRSSASNSSTSSSEEDPEEEEFEVEDIYFDAYLDDNGYYIVWIDSLTPKLTLSPYDNLGCFLKTVPEYIREKPLDFTWSSSDPETIAVDDNGNLTCFKSGESQITATIQGKSAKLMVACVMDIDNRDYSIYMGEELDLIPYLRDRENYYRIALPADDFIYSLSNPSMVSVDENNKLTAHRGQEGYTIITLKYKYYNEHGYNTGRSRVSVYDPTPRGIKLNKESLNLKIGEFEDLEATIIPSYAVHKGFVWESSDPTIASVDNNGRVLANGDISSGTGKSGSAIITVKSKSISKTASCQVTVDIPVTNLEIERDKLSLAVGESISTTILGASVTPDSATNKKIIYQSSDENIVKIDDNGYIVALSPGEAVISVKPEDGNCSADCLIDVCKALKLYNTDDTSFSLDLVGGVSGKKWNGVVEYLIPESSEWAIWDGEKIQATKNYTEEYAIYLRGKNCIIGSTIVTEARYCSGDIRVLLDYEDVENTIMEEGCFSRLFSEAQYLISAPELPATTLSKNCYRSMFDGCNLTSAPALPAKTLAENCYSYMFYNCKSLEYPPALPAETLKPFCYYAMFYNCTSLIAIPSIPAMYFDSGCCDFMFRNCTLLKLSTTQEGDYKNKFELVNTNNAIVSNPFLCMFDGTGGTFQETLDLGGQVLWTSNEVIK